MGDLWNNEVGRKLALTHKTKDDLADAIKSVLEAGELIINLSDERVYQGTQVTKPEGEHSVIVLQENETGGNEYFFDMSISKGMSRVEFVQKISIGRYPGYSIRNINGVDYPVSKKDRSDTNNLG